MQKITPFLWFDDQAEEAVRFYTSLFRDAKTGKITRYGEDTPGPAGTIMTISFALAGLEFTALNGGPQFTFTPAISFFVTCQSEEEIDALWEKLSDGGNILMELGPYPFSEKFGWLADRYGLTWQLSLTGAPQNIMPFLMFVGAQNGRAEDAMRFYTSVFPNSSIQHIERYGKEMGEPEGNVLQAKFVLSGQEFMAIDSGLAHPFTFTPATSLYVNCADQAEVDYFWETLSIGGEKGPCGWLTDRFGVSWQVVPQILIDLMNDPDAEKASRVTQAMLKMSKIDIGQLQQAYAQG